ncbi:MAG: autotransporter-associated beta strand repeat-containing protein, partial [Planctomycetota bacterium]
MHFPLAGSADGATWWWNTTSTGLWSSGANWSNASSGGTTGTAPTDNTTADIAVFNQSGTNGNETVQLNANRSINGMVFANTGSTSLTSDSTTARLLTIGGSGITVNAGAGTVTLGDPTNTLNLAVAASQSFTNNSTSTLSVLGSISRGSADATSRTLTVTGSGNTVLSGLLSDGGGTGNLSLTKSGSGALTLTGNNTYSGATTLSAGILRIGANSVGSVGAITSSAIGVGAFGWATGATIAGSDSSTTRTLYNSFLGGNGITFGDGVNNASVELAGSFTNNLVASVTNNIGGSGVLTLSGRVNLSEHATAGRSITLSGSGATVISGVISNGTSPTVGNGGIVYNGSGALILTGSNTFGGGASLQAGVVRIGLSSAGSIGAITSGPFGSGTVSMSNTTLAGTDSSSTRVILNPVVSGAGNVIGDGTNNASIGFGGSFVNTTYNSNVFTNNLAGSGTFTMSGPVFLGEAAFGRTLTFAGPGVTVISGSVANGVTAGASAAGVVMNGSGALVLSSPNSNFGGGVTLKSGTLRIGASSTLSSGSIAGGPLGLGSLTWQGNNVTTGDDASTARTIHNQLVVQSLGVNPVFGDGVNNASLNFAGPVVLWYSDKTVTNNISGNGTLTFSGTFSPTQDTNGRTITFAGDGNTVISGVFVNGTAAGTSASSITKNGNGTLTLSGQNTYTGATTLAAGVVNLGSAETSGTSGPLGKSVAGNPGNIVLSGGTLQYSLANNNDYSGRFSTASNQRYNVDTNGQNVTWSTALTSSGGSLSKSGSGTLTLSASNSYTGSTTVSGGTLAVGNANALGSASARLIASGGTIDLGGYNVTRSGTVSFTGGVVQSGTITNNTIAFDGQSGTVSAVLAGSVGFAKSSSGTLVLSGSNSYSGGTTLNAGVLNLGSANAIGSSGTISFGGGTLQFSGSNTTDYSSRFSTAASQAYSIDTNGQAVSLASALSSSGGTLTKFGTGALTLSGSNSYTGTTTINAGSISFGNKNAFSATSGISIAGGAGLTYTGAADTFSRNITVTSGTGTVTNSGSQTLTLGGTLTKDGTVLRLTGGTFNVTGLIVGSSSNSDLVIDAATVTLSNTNTYNGPTFVQNASTLILGTNNVIPSTSPVTVNASTLTVAGYSDTIGSLTTVGNSTINVTLSGASGGSLSMGNLAFGSGTNTLALTMTSPTAGIYNVLSYTGSKTGSFTTTGLDGNYTVLTGSAANGVIAVQRKAEIGTITATPAAASIITGGSTAFTFTVQNSTPSGGATLVPTLSAGSNVGGSATLASVGAASTSGSVSGFVFTGTSVGAGRTGSFTVNDSSAIATTGTGSVSVNV